MKTAKVLLYTRIHFAVGGMLQHYSNIVEYMHDSGLEFPTDPGKNSSSPLQHEELPQARSSFTVAGNGKASV